MKPNKRLLLLTIILPFFLLNHFGFPEIIEKIYAVVNDEIITYSELKHFEQGMIAELKTEYQGEELEKAIKERKENLLDMMIERKLILSKAKEKDYDVEQYLEIVIKEIMNNNNIATIEDLKSALAASGINYEEWRKIRKDELISQNLIQNEIGSKIKVENSELMEYYRRNTDKYTKPAEISLNCIFLDKENYFSQSALSEKMDEINAKLKAEGANFQEIAGEYSELPNPDNKVFLGTFKKGELNVKIEEASLKLKPDEHSDWLETENGWYIVQLIKYTEAQLIEYKTVREEIDRIIREEKIQKGVEAYLVQLKKEAHIKIYQEYK